MKLKGRWTGYTAKLRQILAKWIPIGEIIAGKKLIVIQTSAEGFGTVTPIMERFS